MGDIVKFRRTILVVLGILMLIMPYYNAQAKAYTCSNYSADTCPSNACRVDNGACVKAYVGDSFCTDEHVINAMRVLGYFIFIAKILIPLIIIGFSVFDMYHAVFGGDDNSLKDSAKKLAIRFLIGFSVFLVPSILNIILTAIDEYDDVLSDSHICQVCLLKPQECENGVPSDTNLYDKDIFVPSETYDTDTDEDDEDEDIVIDPNQIKEEAQKDKDKNNMQPTEELQ